jgi:hypothetical protein
MRARVPAGVRELLLIAVLFLVYKGGRLATAEHLDQALDFAATVWSLERFLDLPSEAALQQALLPHDAVIRGANVYYAWVHFPITAGTLLWAWFRDRSSYLWIRRAMTLLTIGALILHVVAPLAPPRMVTELGFVDTGEAYGQSVYSQGSAVSGLANQLAAMPSLHVGWAAVVALAIVTISRSRWRFVALVHPVITALVVVVTANHWWLDGIVSLGLLAVAVALVRRPAARPAEVAGFRPRAEVALG